MSCSHACPEPVGGADVAAELDAKRAIWQATDVALELQLCASSVS